MSNKPLAIAIMGPTASGKTDLAIGLYQALKAEVISADSALIYKGMDIGTAKPTAEELKAAPHALIDIKDPAEAYSAAEFARDASTLIQTCVASGKTPIVGGGDYVVFQSAFGGLGRYSGFNPRSKGGCRA